MLLISMSGVMASENLANNNNQGIPYGDDGIDQSLDKKVCCATASINPEPSTSYDVMEREDCLGPTVAIISREIVDDKYCKETSKPIPKYPVTVEFKVGNSLLLDDTNGILELTAIDNIVSNGFSDIRTGYVAIFTFTSNEGVGFQQFVYESDTFSISPFSLFVKDITEFEVVLEITRTDILPQPVPSQNRVCCKVQPVVANPVPSYNWMDKEDCFVLEQMVGASREIVDDKFCKVTDKPIDEESGKKSREIIRVRQSSNDQIASEEGKSSNIIRSVKIVPGNKKPIILTQSGKEVKSLIDTNTGFSMSVKSSNGEEKIMTFESTEDLWNKMTDENQVRVKTRRTFVNNENGFGIETPNGIKEIKILPSQASDRAKEVLTEIFGEIELKEEQGRVFYDFNEEKRVKVLGFIPVKAKYSAQVDAESGELINSQRPWFDSISSK